MRNIKLYEDFINEKKPKGAPDFHHSDAPDAEGRFRDLSPKKLAAWLIKTRNKDVKKISGSLTQQVVFNRNEDPEYADKMERTRKEVYKQLGREDLLDNMKESMNNEINERVLLIMKDVVSKMIGTGFSYKTSPKLKEELKDAIAAAITPILKKYDYAVQESKVNEEGGRDTLAELTQMTMSQLERIEDYAEMIKDRMEQGQELDSWMFSQITVALENLNAVHDSLAGDAELEESWRINKYVKNLDQYIFEKYPKSQWKWDAKHPYSFRIYLKDGDKHDTDFYDLESAKKMKQLLDKDKETYVIHKSKDGQFSDEVRDLMRESLVTEEKAKGNRGPLKNPDIEVALKKKSEESGIDIALLRIVMRRGMDAWNSGHRPGMGQEQWGYARVNSFIDKEKGTWGGADKDVAAEVK